MRKRDLISVLLLGVLALGAMIGWALASRDAVGAEKEAEAYRQQLNAAYFVFEAIASNKDELREMRVLLQENPGNNLVYVTTHTPAKTERGTASTSVFTIFSDGNLKVERYDDTSGAKTWETVKYRGDHYAKK